MSCLLSRKPVSIGPLLALGAGLALTGILCVRLINAEAGRNDEAQERAADLRQVAFQEEFDEALDGLAIFTRLFSSAEPIPHKQFQELAMQLVELHPYVQAFSFVRVVPAAQRHSYEIEQRRLMPGFRIVDLRDGILVPAAGRDQYHVIEYISPLATNRPAQGLDIASLPGQVQALARSRSTGLPSASGPFNLVPGTGKERVFAVVMPVFRKGSAGRNAQADENTVTGYVAVVFRTSRLMERVLHRAALMQSHDVDINVYVENGGTRELIYRLDNGHDEVWPNDSTESKVRSFSTAGLRWYIEASRSAGLVSATPASAWLALATGVSVTVLLALYLQSLGVRASELAQVNARLREDIDGRRRAEQALRESEERFRHLAGLSSDWYWEQDADLRFTYFSTESIFNIKTADFLHKKRVELPMETDYDRASAHKALLKARQPFTDMEYRIRAPNGKLHWVLISGEPLFDADGNFRGYRGTGKDITGRKQVEEALKQSQTELRELAAYQTRVKEEERKRIAREIHDDLGQTLLALRIDVSLLDEATRDNHFSLNTRVRGLLTLVDGVIKSVRSIINDLRPSVLDLGLYAAIEWQVRQFKHRTGIPCSLSLEGGDIDARLGEEAATSVFRIVQESLTNVSRHAHATQVKIRLILGKDALKVEISDDGIGGLLQAHKPSTFGLIGIRERVIRLGGTFLVHSPAGQGTSLRFTIPAAEAAHIPA